MTEYEPIEDTERKEFFDQGFLLLRNVLTEEHRLRLEAATDRVYEEEIAAGRGRSDGTVHLLSFVTRDALFGELLTHPATFRYVWGLLGWNIYSHRVVIRELLSEPVSTARPALSLRSMR